MIRGHPEIRGTALILNDLENRLQDADHRAVRLINALREPAQPVEVTEEFVGSVD